MTGTFPEREYHVENSKNLPVVKSCFDTRTLNMAIEAGHQTCVVKVVSNPRLKLSGLLLRNKSTGQFEVVSSRQMPAQYARVIEYSYEDWETVEELSGYARNRKANSGWGAYILPLGVQPGDRVYIEDLIEDVFASGFWRSVGAAADAEAIWTGRNLEIDHSVYLKFERIG